VSYQLNVPDLVQFVAARAAIAAFWEGLADFAATLKIRDRVTALPCANRANLLARQPFISRATRRRRGLFFRTATKLSATDVTQSL
jgi:hypothetical protein